MNRPLPLAVTMGDPAGIGPEIVAATVASSAGDRPLLVVGDPAVMERAVAIAAPGLGVRAVEGPAAAAFAPGTVDVLAATRLDGLPAFGRVDAAAGRAAYEAIAAAIGLARDGAVAGIVTAPINKEALAAAGIGYPGHTEILADLGGAGRVAMMLANDDIRTVLVTIHLSLRDAIAAATFEAQRAAVALAHEGCRALGIDRPRIAVAGLNPHAGEGGLFGEEEIRIIGPAIEAARADGLDVSGPHPGDTVFMNARRGRFDVVVAQYHDQGLIPVKYLGLERGVNITLGLPFVRTSPDHGTAFDIAGTGRADPASLSAAVEYALRLAAARERR